MGSVIVTGGSRGIGLVVRYGAANLTAQVCICGGAILGLASAGRRDFATEVAHASPAAWIALACLAVLSTVLAYTLWYVALERRSAAKLTMFAYLKPVFGVALSAAVLGKAVGMTVISGAVVVVGGLALTNLK
jgi:drug/metabolite transporter (DMT)-like permease